MAVTMTLKTFFRRAALGSATVAALSGAMSANASVFVLNFAGLNGNLEEAVMSYYNGGAGSLGSTGGPSLNYGISFGADALVASGQPGGIANTAQIPGGSGSNALFFQTGTGDVMNVAAGFSTGFSFYYSAPTAMGTLQIWTGLNGTGTQIVPDNMALADIPLDKTTDGSTSLACLNQQYCPYAAFGVTFGGVAKSVIFTGSANNVAFAEVTIGSATPGGSSVPAPATLALVGLGLLGAYVVGRRTAA
jgi:hypothetical protein